MSGLLHHLRLSLRLHLRNKMALIYGYLFPLIFLVAFWVLYRHEKIPLLRHMGELLTVAVLGGACFGLPTTLVSERERGVWRRYRLTPVPTWAVVVSTVIARYFIILSAGVLQMGLAFALGMTAPEHPFALWIVFTFAAFSFIGLGLVIATMADTVPAVQALGQCIFLPMLIIGGVAVQLPSLPDWAQRLSSYFPGRYSVEGIQACVTGDGLPAAGFCLFALALIGLAGCIAGGKLFRWDAQQRFAGRGGKGWIASVLAAWLIVGYTANSRGRGESVTATEANRAVASVALEKEGHAARSASTDSISEGAGDRGTAAVSSEIPPPPSPTTPPDVGTAKIPPPTLAPGPSPSPSPAPVVAAVPVPSPVSTSGPAPSPAVAAAVVSPTPKPAAGSWKTMTAADIASLNFDVPPDRGVVAPYAGPEEQAEDYTADEVEAVRRGLQTWKPALVEDDVQRVRNLLYVAAVPDAIQMPVERYLPPIVFTHLTDIYPKETLTKILTWIAKNPDEGSVILDISALGVQGAAGDPWMVRERAYLYAIKYLARLTGRPTG